MTETDWRRIKETPFNEMMKLQDNEKDKINLNYLATDYEGKVTIGGENAVDWLMNIYYLATKDICDKAVTSFLCSIDDSEVIKELANGIFINLAAEQRKKVTFEKLIDSEIKRRNQKQKAEEKELKKAKAIEFRESMPEYYGAEISQSVIEKILAENNITVRLNLVTKKLEVQGRGSELLFKKYSKDNITSTLPTVILDLCKANEISGLGSGVKMINTYLFNLADENRYNPIRDMLESHKNENSEHLETVYKILGLSDDFDKTLVKKWLIQTVAFAYGSLENPISTEGVLVLQGEQGICKTSFFRKMAGEPLWFTEGAVIDTRNKDSLLTAISGWICELGEIDSTFKKEQSALKGFITRTVDKIRLPYAPADSDMPRTTSMCGTVNPEQFLKDTTGNRRYWTVHISNIDKNALFALTKGEVFDIWGYIYHLYLQDKNGFRLNDIEREKVNIINRRYAAKLPFEDEIREIIDLNKPTDTWLWFSPAEIAECYPKMSAEQVGRVFSKIAEEETRVQKARHKSGYKYLLPISRYLIENRGTRYYSTK